jgi:hypothetical protein
VTSTRCAENLSPPTRSLVGGDPRRRNSWTIALTIQVAPDRTTLATMRACPLAGADLRFARSTGRVGTFAINGQRSSRQLGAYACFGDVPIARDQVPNYTTRSQRRSGRTDSAYAAARFCAPRSRPWIRRRGAFNAIASSPQHSSAPSYPGDCIRLKAVVGPRASESADRRAVAGVCRLAGDMA